MIKTINFKNSTYPLFQSQGFAAKFVFPFAKEVCTGTGYDIGCMKKEWALPGAIPIDLCFNDGFHALNLPLKDVDFIFSSHCLEHIEDWCRVLDYWLLTLKKGGTLFLYLPHWEQVYWRPWHNKKHRHVLSSTIIQQYLIDQNISKVFIGEKDLNCSFTIMAEK